MNVFIVHVLKCFFIFYASNVYLSRLAKLPTGLYILLALIYSVFSFSLL